eukprot:GHVU01055271.1.p2 GENE.GHVU01055271.1~~GHVU01055271.1.p2  ORF type:complete len:100 (+),score=2.48 GHVU01055271.1:290-589(+)
MSAITTTVLNKNVHKPSCLQFADSVPVKTSTTRVTSLAVLDYRMHSPVSPRRPDDAHTVEPLVVTMERWAGAATAAGGAPAAPHANEKTSGRRLSTLNE